MEIGGANDQAGHGAGVEEPASSDAAHDTELATILNAWGALPPAIKAGIIAMVKASQATP
jgi:hypothetical protein